MTDPSRQLVLIGGGGHALVVAESAVAAGFTLRGFLDDDPEARLHGLAPRLGPIADLSALGGAKPIVAIGDIGLRMWVIRRIQSSAATVVHPSAVVSPSATLGAGVFVGPLAVVHSRAVIGDHAIINTNAIVEHDCEVGANAHIAPGSVLGGAASVGPASLLGIGCRVLPGLRVGARAVVAAGAVVTQAVHDSVTVVGVPARERRRSAF